MLQAHPYIVHFPVALLITSGMFAFLSLRFKKDLFSTLSFWNLALGIVGIIAAVFTGRNQAGQIPHNETIHEIMERHEFIAYIVLTFAVLLFLWALPRRENMKNKEYMVYVIILLSVCGTIAYTAHLGGTMVYKFGAGVKPMEQTVKENHQHNNHNESHKH